MALVTAFKGISVAVLPQLFDGGGGGGGTEKHIYTVGEGYNIH